MKIKSTNKMKKMKTMTMKKKRKKKKEDEKAIAPTKLHLSAGLFLLMDSKSNSVVDSQDF